MASLAELIDPALSMTKVMTRFFTALKTVSETLYMSQLEGEEIELYQYYLKRVTERNEKLLVRLLLMQKDPSSTPKHRRRTDLSIIIQPLFLNFRFDPF